MRLFQREKKPRHQKTTTILFLCILHLCLPLLTKVGFLSELPAEPLHGLCQEGLSLGVAWSLLLAPHTGHGVHHAHLGPGSCAQETPVNEQTRPARSHTMSRIITPLLLALIRVSLYILKMYNEDSWCRKHWKTLSRSGTFWLLHMKHLQPLPSQPLSHLWHFVLKAFFFPSKHSDILWCLITAGTKASHQSWRCSQHVLN